MINNNYVEDYILNSDQFIDEFDVDAIVEELHHVALVSVAYVEHMDKSELNTYLAYPMF